MNPAQVPTHNHNVSDLPMDAISTAFSSGATFFGIQNDVQFFIGTVGQFVLKFDTSTNPDQLSLAGGDAVTDANGYAMVIGTPNASSVTGARTTGGITFTTGNATNGGNASGATGGFTFTTGNSADSSSGAITFQSGTATNVQSRGDFLTKTRAFQQPPIRTNGGLNMSLGTPPSLLVQDLSDPASGDTSYAQVRSIRIARIYAIKDANAGGAGDQIVVKNNAGATIATLNLNVAANTIVNPSTLTTANGTIAAGGNITFTTTKVTNAGCTVFIQYLPTSEAA